MHQLCRRPFSRYALLSRTCAAGVLHGRGPGRAVLWRRAVRCCSVKEHSAMLFYRQYIVCSMSGEGTRQRAPPAEVSNRER
eukprot:9860057-Lingulodinium_polyedra.AAC.1